MKSSRWFRVVALVSVFGFALLLPTTISPSAQALPGTNVENQLGFDNCSAFSESTMKGFWSSTDYWWVGVYIGGDEWACSGSGVPSASWFSGLESGSYGWDFLPIWVGPQAPCTTGYANTFSYDTTTADYEGAAQATDAIDEMLSIGFPSSNDIVYYDLEPFNQNNQSCDAAVQAFAQGWDELMDGDGMYAGWFGNVDQGDFNGLATISNPPNDIAFAYYDGDPNIYDTDGYINSGYWVNDQRNHQYSNTAKAGSYTVDADCNWSRLQGAFSYQEGTDSC